MEVRPEALEGGFVQLFLELRMGNGDDEFGAFLQRTSVEVHGAIFRDEPVDVVARGDSTRTQVQSRHNLVDALARGGRHRDDGFAAFGARGAIDVIDLSAHA